MKIKKIENIYIKRKEKMFKKGKISWLNPAKIAKQPILDAIHVCKKYVSGNVLDIGCGDKPYKQTFEKEIIKYTGIDPYNKNADIRAFATKLPLKNNSFNTIISTQVLEHLENPDKMLGEAYRVLKRKGYIILTAPMTWPLHEEPRDFYRYTKYGLKYLFESNGFKIIKIIEHGGFWGVIGQKLSMKFFGNSKGTINKVMKGPFCAIIQWFFLVLDYINKDYSETLGYTVIAKK